ncbi:hypothetical protein B0J13DRAFT_111536 [Dactylonectria estremocensis]|uniref:Uncharacterized protein n=1 Tax=Dactylonectria estremocensis TaxID=1079267 RepID=A0A9P9FEY8_9HYPO|nr:hypothetical protein B0J13DRAFT_111536 [Dactylonectria estremocensis]
MTCDELESRDGNNVALFSLVRGSSWGRDSSHDCSKGSALRVWYGGMEYVCLHGWNYGCWGPCCITLVLVQSPSLSRIEMISSFVFVEVMGLWCLGAFNYLRVTKSPAGEPRHSCEVARWP